MTPIGPEDVTPSKPPRRQHGGDWAAMTTDEYRLVQTVAKRERRISWWKAIGVAGGAVAFVQFATAAGPCATGWKFKTIEAAAQDHAAIRQETSTMIMRVEDKIEKGNENVLNAIVELSKKGNKK